METRANSLIVGFGILFLLAGFIAFILWMGRSEWSKAQTYYTIYFERSVTGLLKESIVTYQGVPIGIVKKIQLSLPDMRRVKVTIALKNSIHLREGVKASLELQGLTGNLSVRLRGDNPPEAPLLKAPPGQPYPVIPFESSPFDSLVTSAPEVMHKLSKLLDDISLFFNGQNKEHFSKILSHTEKISASLEESIGPLKKLLTEFDHTAQTLTKTSQGWQEVAKDTQQVIQENRKNIQEFTRSGLPELMSLLQESRDMVRTISETTEKLSRNPLRFFKGQEQEGYVLE